jgi:hypothetical protein
MDVGPLVSMVWKIFALLFVIVVVKGVLTSRSFKGWLGEFRVRQVTTTQLDAETYRQFHDVTLPTEDGTTQIDHIIVSPYGVFVIETKNMGGWIFGNPNHAKWTQTFGKSKNSFQNPLRQNYKHIKELEALLQIGADKLFSVVVFTGNAEFKTDMPDNVMRSGRLAGYVLAKSAPILTESEVQRILLRINEAMLERSAETRALHIRNLASKHGPNKPDRQIGEVFSKLKIAAIALVVLGAFSLFNKATRPVPPSSHVTSASIASRPPDSASPPTVASIEAQNLPSAPVAKDETRKPNRTPRSAEYGFLTLSAKMDTYVTLYDTNSVEVVRMEMKKGQEKEIEIRKGYYTAEILQAGKREVSSVSFIGNTGVLEF